MRVSVPECVLYSDDLAYFRSKVTYLAEFGCCAISVVKNDRDWLSVTCHLDIGDGERIQFGTVSDVDTHELNYRPTLREATDDCVSAFWALVNEWESCKDRLIEDAKDAGPKSNRSKAVLRLLQLLSK